MMFVGKQEWYIKILIRRGKWMFTKTKGAAPRVTKKELIV